MAVSTSASLRVHLGARWYSRTHFSRDSLGLWRRLRLLITAPRRPNSGETPVLTPQWTQEIEYVHALTRTLAALHDTRALLTELCQSVVHLAHADGSAVVSATGSDLCVEAVAGSGIMRVGGTYPLVGSLAYSAITRRRLVIERDYASRPTAQQLSTTRGPIGEMLAAPLIAAKNNVLGVILAWRAREAGSFIPADRDRVQLFGDFASLCSTKSQLAGARASSESSQECVPRDPFARATHTCGRTRGIR